jgi:NAD(P)-dependent dehydrogenase (short-subunit alcohol dehydrogenase family)
MKPATSTVSHKQEAMSLLRDGSLAFHSQFGDQNQLTHYPFLFGFFPSLALGARISGLDVLVNNAGAVEDTSLDNLRGHIETNLSGTNIIVGR